MSLATPQTRLQATREARGYTRTQLAAYAGISASYVTLLEKRQRHGLLPTRQRLAAALGLSPHELYLPPRDTE